MSPVRKITGPSSRLPSPHWTRKRFGLGQTMAMSRSLRTGAQLGATSPATSTCPSIPGSVVSKPHVLIQVLLMSLAMGIGQRIFGHTSSRQPTTGKPGLRSLTESRMAKQFTWSKKILKIGTYCTRVQNLASSIRLTGGARGTRCSATYRWLQYTTLLCTREKTTS